MCHRPPFDGLMPHAYEAGRQSVRSAHELDLAPVSEASSVGDSGVRQLLGRGSTYTLARFAQLGGMMIVLPLVTRALGPASFGRASLAVVVSQVLQLFASAGLPSAITRRYFERGGDAAARRLSGSTVVVASILASVAAATEPHWSPLVGLDIDRLGIIVAVSVVPLAALGAGQALLRAQDRPVPFVASALVSSIGAQAIGLGATELHDESAATYLWGLVAGYGLAAVISLYAGGVLFSSPGRAEFESAIRFGVPTIAHSVAMYVMSAGDRIVIERVDGAAAVARYQVIYVVAALGILLLNSINNAWSPLVYGGSDDDRWIRLRETSDVVVAIAAIIATGLGVGGPAAVRLLVPGEFIAEDIAVICALVAGSALPYAIFIAYALPLFHERRTTSIAIATVIVAAANLALNAALVPAVGIVGAALATLLSYLGLGLAIRRIASEIPGVVISSTRERIAVIGATGGTTVAAVLPVGDGWLIIRGAASVLVGLAGIAVIAARERSSRSLDA